MCPHVNSTDVASRSVDACNEARLDRIDTTGEHNRNRLGGRFRRERGSRTARCDNGRHLAAYKIGRNLGQSIILPLCPAVIDGYILALDKSCLPETCAKSDQKVSNRLCGRRSEESNYRHRRLLRARRERRRRHCAAEQRDELAPLHYNNLLMLQGW